VHPLLRVNDLTVRYRSSDLGEFTALEGVTLDIAAGEAVGLLGESGCGKTTLGLALLGLLPAWGKVTGGSAVFRGRNLLTLAERELRKVRGAEISMVHQEPGAALNPVLRVGEQVAAVLRAHRQLSRERAREEAGVLLAQVGLGQETCIEAAYPHQLSGGQQQRVAIAQAIASGPALVIADEPTTALDSITQLEILNLLKSLREKLRVALLLITHDPAVIVRAVDRVLVMRAGCLVEQGATREVTQKPRHIYTQELLNSTLVGRQHKGHGPRIAPKPDGASIFVNLRSPQDLSEKDQSRRRGNLTGSADRRASEREDGDGFIAEPAPADGQFIEAETLLCAVNLYKCYVQGRWLSRGRNQVEALRGVGFELRTGSTLALIGASGSGKSTLARCLAYLEKPDAGEVWFGGRDLARLSPRELIPVRRQIQLLFQDPGSSLNPRFTAVEIVSEPLLTVRPSEKKESRERALALIELVGLRAEWGQRLPQQFSAGQRRRLAIARALALEPKLLILDEALAGLDLPIQAQIADLLLELQSTLSLTYLYISHDLSLVAQLADQVAVLHQGQIVEAAAMPELFAKPRSRQAINLVSATLDRSCFSDQYQ
jgi:peptide/nickel transport system ATP-binding protein